MDGYGAISIMARIQCFAETLFNAERTSIERGGDAAFDCWKCQIFTRWHAYEVTSAGGIVCPHAQVLDSMANEPTLIAEVQTVDERSMATLRACISALETISELRQTKNVAGLRMLQHLIAEALGGPRIVRRRLI
jgi:hypothetical protein